MYNLLMRKIIDWLLLIVVLGVAGYGAYTHKVQVRRTVRFVRGMLLPCSYPIQYSIGSIDPLFGISTDTLIDDLKEAEAAWEAPSGIDLFEYAVSSGDVTINLIYDSRQAATDKLQAMGIKTDQSRASYDELKARYDVLLAQVEAAQQRRDIVFAAYTRKEAAYNGKVQYLNQARTAASASQRKRLNARRRALEQEFSGLKAQEGRLNGNIDTLNAYATVLNQLIVELNINVQQYKRAGAVMGQFEEGLYKMSHGIQTIDIYRYTNRLQLISLLAHEMGHAAGLEHTPDPETVMYKINMGNDLKITPKDIAELNRVCAAGLRRARP